MPFPAGVSGNPSTQFKPGNNANPNGYPKGRPHLTTLLRKIADTRTGEIDKETGEPITYEQKTWLVAAIQATEGDKDARRDLTNYLYGKPVERHELDDGAGEKVFKSQDELESELAAVRARLDELKKDENEVESET